MQEKVVCLIKLLNNERSIVHDRPGTTRDYISEYIKVGKFNIQIFDTAGIRDGGIFKRRFGSGVIS